MRGSVNTKLLFPLESGRTGARVCVAFALKELDIHERGATLAREQRVGELERITPDLVVVDTDYDVFEHAARLTQSGVRRHHANRVMTPHPRELQIGRPWNLVLLVIAKRWPVQPTGRILPVASRRSGGGTRPQ